MSQEIVEIPNIEIEKEQVKIEIPRIVHQSNFVDLITPEQSDDENQNMNANNEFKLYQSQTDFKQMEILKQLENCEEEQDNQDDAKMPQVEYQQQIKNATIVINDEQESIVDKKAQDLEFASQIIQGFQQNFNEAKEKYKDLLPNNTQISQINTKNPIFIDVEVEEDVVIVSSTGPKVKQKSEDPPIEQPQPQIIQPRQEEMEIENIQNNPLNIPDIEDDDYLNEMDLNIEWIPLTQLNDIPAPKFQGIKKNIVTSDPPRSIIKFMWSEQKFRDVIDQVGYSETDFWLWLGVRIMMGYMKLPEAKDYFLKDDWLAGGGIRSIITQSTFFDIDNTVEIIQSQNNQNTLLAIKLEANNQNFFNEEIMPQFMADLNDKFSKTLLPGQELLLIKNPNILRYSSIIDHYQLIDRETGFILNQFFWNLPEKSINNIINSKNLQKRIRKMFEHYNLQKHIVYCQSGILDAESVVFLLVDKKIFICTELKQHSLLPNKKVFHKSAKKDALYLIYKEEWITFASTQSLNNRVNYIEGILSTLHNQDAVMIQPCSYDKPNQQILFSVVMESIIQNMAAQKGKYYGRDEFKKFRVELALNLVDKTIDYKESRPLESKKSAKLQDKGCMTDLVTGVSLEKLYHVPIHIGNARCLVCIYHKILTKTTACCEGCSNALGLDIRENKGIFLCVYPCFRLYHLEPKKYLKADQYHQVVEGYLHHDVDDEFEEKAPQKPDTSELDLIYAKKGIDTNLFNNSSYIPICYDDDYHHKTKYIKYVQPKKQGRQKTEGKGGGGKGRPKKQQQGIESEQGNQGQAQAQPTKEVENKEADKTQSKQQVIDFFNSVKKKIMSQPQK